MDSRIEKFAKTLIHYSCAVKKGEKVLVEVRGQETFPLVECLIKEIASAGGLPFYLLHDQKIEAAWKLVGSEEQMGLEATWQLARMKEMDCYIHVMAQTNFFEESHIPTAQAGLYSKTVWKKVHNECRLSKTRWVVCRFPTQQYASSAKMDTRSFEDFFYQACLLDYGKMDKAMDPLADLMTRTDRVKIVGPGETSLEFSIKGIGAMKCAGRANIPDGEVFTAPVRESINGVSFCNTMTTYDGAVFDGVHLTWKNGQIVQAICDVGDQKKLDSILNRDAGARYAGEFAIGCNPYIREPMLENLFDEKIVGSFHLTPGKAYDEASNGNKSEVHWDMVYRQLKEHGGGEIYFDDVLIRKDGIFVLDSLKGLNPDQLLNK